MSDFSINSAIKILENLQPDYSKYFTSGACPKTKPPSVDEHGGYVCWECITFEELGLLLLYKNVVLNYVFSCKLGPVTFEINKNENNENELVMRHQIYLSKNCVYNPKYYCNIDCCVKNGRGRIYIKTFDSRCPAFSCKNYSDYKPLTFIGYQNQPKDKLEINNELISVAKIYRQFAPSRNEVPHNDSYKPHRLLLNYLISLSDNNFICYLGALFLKKNNQINSHEQVKTVKDWFYKKINLNITLNNFENTIIHNELLTMCQSYNKVDDKSVEKVISECIIHYGPSGKKERLWLNCYLSFVAKIEDEKVSTLGMEFD